MVFFQAKEEIHVNTDKATIERLRKDLPTIRNIVGWSAEYLASLLDVSRVTIVNLENTENKMTTIQYLAIRALLQEEITVNKNKTLESVLKVLVDRDNVPERMKQELRDQAALAAKTVGRKAGSAAIGKAASESVGPIVEKTLGELKLSEIPPETILRGQAIVDELLTKPINQTKNNRRKNHNE